MTTNVLRAGWHRPMLFLAAVMAGTAVVALVGIFVDPRVLTGAPIWDKPFKFAVSITLYLLTLVWMLSVLPRRSRVAEWSATVVTGALVAEMLVIVGQVIRGRTSHFDVATPLDAALWHVMSVSIAVLFAAHLVIAVVALKQRIGDRVTAYAVRLGLGLTALGMLAALPMVVPRDGAPEGGHTVGLPDGGPGLPLLGWSTVGGDLRIGHFVGLHGLQAMPLLMIALAALGNRLGETVRARLLLVAAGGYALVTASLTWQALRGQPLMHPDGRTLAVWAGIVVATAAAGGWVLTRHGREQVGPGPRSAARERTQVGADLHQAPHDPGHGNAGPRPGSDERGQVGAGSQRVARGGVVAGRRRVSG